MLADVISFLIFHLRRPAALRLAQDLVAARLRRAKATRCRAEDGVLVLGTDQGREVRYSTEALLLQLNRLDPEAATPALVDLVNAYDHGGLLLSRLLWSQLCVAASPVVIFSYRQGVFSAHSAKPLRLRRGVRAVEVVKRSGSIVTKVQPTRVVQEALVGVLRRMVFHGQEKA
jgi:hypothetical protein